MDDELSASVQALLEVQIAKGQQIGIQVAAYHRGKPLVSVCAGTMGRRDRRHIAVDSLTNAFSTSKGVAALAVHMLADRGVLEYDAPVSEYWPRFAQRGKADITVAQAMSHQAGLYRVPRPLTMDFVVDWDAGVRWIEELEPAHAPGERFIYHAMTYAWISGGIVQAASGLHIADFVAKEIAEPLGVGGEMYFGIPEGVEHRLTRLSAGASQGSRAGMADLGLPPDHVAFDAIPPDSDLNYNDLRMRRSCNPAATGHFSARALARMYGALANGGEIDGTRLVSADRIAEMNRIRVRGIEESTQEYHVQGIGYSMGGPGGSSTMGPRSTSFGFPGNGGAIGFADPELGLGMAVIGNLINPNLPGGGPTFDICELVREGLATEQSAASSAAGGER